MVEETSRVIDESSLRHRVVDYDHWHERLATFDGQTDEPTEPWHRTVIKLLPDLNGQRLLEIGCGRGDFSIWLSKQFPDAEVVGLDFSSKAISIAQARADAAAVNARFVVGDAEALGFSEDEFDYVISCECFEHVPNPKKMAREIGRVLKPSGQFILTTENYFNGMLLGWLMSWIRKAKFNSGSGVQPHENFFLFWRVKALLESGGLKINHMESNHFQWLLLPGTNPARLLTPDFGNPLLKRIFRPFGRHFTFAGSVLKRA